MVGFGAGLDLRHPLEGTRSLSGGKTFAHRALNPVLTKHSILLSTRKKKQEKKISRWKMSPRKAEERSKFQCRMRKPALWEVVKAKNLEETLEGNGLHLPKI